MPMLAAQLDRTKQKTETPRSVCMRMDLFGMLFVRMVVRVRAVSMSMSNEHYLSYIRSEVGPIEIELCPTFMCHVMLHWTPKSQYLPMMCTHMAQLTHDFTFIETKVKTDWLPRSSATFSFSLAPTYSWKLCSCVGFSTILTTLFLSFTFIARDIDFTYD